jgi:DNA-binding NtrC family response regulator
MSQTVLIVDDEPDLVANCDRVLRRAGFRPLSAYTVAEALRLIDDEHPALVVTDLRLPGADGLVVVRHARQHVPPIPVILITAYDSAHARRAAQENGAATYLAKPFTNSVLLDVVRRALGAPAAAQNGTPA